MCESRNNIMESYFTLRFIDELYSRLTVTPEPPRKVYSRHLDSRGCKRSEHLSFVNLENCSASSENCSVKSENCSVYSEH